MDKASTLNLLLLGEHHAGRQAVVQICEPTRDDLSCDQNPVLMMVMKDGKRGSEQSTLGQVSVCPIFVVENQAPTVLLLPVACTWSVVRDLGVE